MIPPSIPRTGEAVKADWGRKLIMWIKNDVMPKGDGVTTMVKGNIVSARRGTAYEGPFLIIRNGSGGYDVIDGVGIDESYAGYVMFNGELEHVAAGTADGDIPGYLCLAADIASGSVIWSYLLTAYPEAQVTTTIGVYPLGYVGDSGRIFQFPHAVPSLWVSGVCEDSSSGSGSV